MECGKQKTTELHEEKSSTTFGDKRVYTQEKIEVIDDIQIKRQRILKSLNNEFFFKAFWRRELSENLPKLCCSTSEKENEGSM